MALSAILRTKEQVGANLLINILRGSKSIDVYERQYHELKTYGVGKDHSFVDWQQYINQFINLGLIEIAYDDYLKLKVTEAGRAVLYSTDKLAISRPVTKTIAKSPEKKGTKIGSIGIRRKYFIRCIKSLSKRNRRTKQSASLCYFSRFDLE